MPTHDVRFSPTIRRVTILSRNSEGQVAPTLIYESEKKKKRQSRSIEPMEAFVRRAADGMKQCAESYAARHRQSNEKRRDGWVRDLNSNVMRAGRRGAKGAKLSRLMSM
ncbi:MAG TPA: hypothetical protein VM261_38945 [Kofleriaceae bacterium]|nr:hypothetical protein [Kofleriaceae bacterium]